MLGVELRPAARPRRARSCARRSSGSTWAFSPASYLLNRWSVRVLPTLSAPNTLRLEPSAFIDDAGIDQLERGLARPLLGHTGSGSVRAARAFSWRKKRALKDRPAREDDRTWNASLLRGDRAAGRTRCGSRSSTISSFRSASSPSSSRASAGCTARPAVRSSTGSPDSWTSSRACSSREISSAGGSGSRPSSSRRARRTSRSFTEAASRISPCGGSRKRWRWAGDLGCTVGGLGAYTSIVTDDGLMLQPPAGMKLSTGNAFTAAVGVHRVLRLCRRRGIDPGPRTAVWASWAPPETSGLASRTGWRRETLAFRDIVLVGRRVERLRPWPTRSGSSPSVSAAWRSRRACRRSRAAM